jgi:hypothetical protein
MIWRGPAPWALFLPLLAGCAAVASAAHSKPRSIELLDVVFQTTAPGTIETSLDPPIEGVLRIVVHTGASGSQPESNGSAGARTAQSSDPPFTLEVTQSDRPIPFRLVSQGGRHKLAGGGPASLVADIDVNDLTPGVPVRVRVHSTLTAPPDLDGRAYQVVY